MVLEFTLILVFQLVVCGLLVALACGFADCFKPRSYYVVADLMTTGTKMKNNFTSKDNGSIVFNSLLTKSHTPNTTHIC